MNQNLPEPQHKERDMSLIEHIGELRVRLTRAAIGIVVGMCLCWGLGDKIYAFIRKPIQQYLPGGGLVFTSPIDKFMAHIKIAFVMGLIVSAPFWLYQLWKFIAPALYKNERRYAAGFIIFGTFQFVLGVSFAYYIVFPAAFHFLMTFGDGLDVPMITIDHYLGFFTQTALIFGLTFEIPVIITFLGIIGVVSQRFLKEKRRYAIMVITVISAIAAPPDALSMILLMGPLWVMYEISIILVGFFEKKKSRDMEDTL